MDPRTKKFFDLLYKRAGGRMDAMLVRDLKSLEEGEAEGFDMDEQGRFWTQFWEDGLLRKEAQEVFYLTQAGVGVGKGGP